MLRVLNEMAENQITKRNRKAEPIRVAFVQFEEGLKREAIGFGVWGLRIGRLLCFFLSDPLAMRFYPGFLFMGFGFDGAKRFESGLTGIFRYRLKSCYVQVWPLVIRHIGIDSHVLNPNPFTG